MEALGVLRDVPESVSLRVTVDLDVGGPFGSSSCSRSLLFDLQVGEGEHEDFGKLESLSEGP